MKELARPRWHDRPEHKKLLNGWPWVRGHLTFDGRGPALDDFVDASYSYAPISPPTGPWVGVFHHPPIVNSPLEGDQRYALRSIRITATGPLIGAVALCSDVGAAVRRWLGVPVRVARHPTRPASMRWSGSAKPPMLQVGSFLRDVRFIERIPRCGRDRMRLPFRPRPLPRGPIPCVTLPRASEARYDSLLASCVVVSWYYGCAASNTIVECMERCTPLIVNRLPSIEEYLGADYPLYAESPEHVPDLLGRARDASDYLASLPRPSTWLRELVDACQW